MYILTTDPIVNLFYLFWCNGSCEVLSSLWVHRRHHHRRL